MPLLKAWGKQYLLGMTLSGAYAKNTAITLSSHVDVLIGLRQVPGMEMKKIFWSLFEHLDDSDLHPHTRNVSIQVKGKEHTIDVIPACRDQETSSTFLFNKRRGAAIRTDVGQHAHLVANSGRQQEICAVKIWRERNSLDFPSLYLELSVLHALEGERFGQLADNILTLFRYMANRFEQIAIRDPANAENVVSNDLSSKDKKAIADAARTALYDENWKKILW